MSRPRVAVVGAGFGGLRVVRALRKSACDTVLVDRRNHHVFQPLLYQVATAALSPADIAQPVRTIVRGYPNCDVLLAEATAVRLADRVVETSRGDVEYDYLVLAAGATHAYFGHEEWEAFAPGLKSIDDAIEIRRRVLGAFEKAEVAESEEARRTALAFVVVGAGPTGVELAGALKEIAVETIPEDYRRIDTTTARIVLVEGQDRVLPALSRDASRKALAILERMGVEVRLETFVTDIRSDGVQLGDEFLPAGNVVWAAGVRGASIAETLDVPLDGQGRVRVSPDCSVPGHPEVFVIGDLATLHDPVSGLPVPGVAQGAIQMGDAVGRIIAREIRAGDRVPRPAFRYRNKGDLATIGRAKAVADVWGRNFAGFLAWVLWGVVHITFLIGLRNRVLVMVNWLWQWTVHTRGARLITGDPDDRSP